MHTDHVVEYETIINAPIQKVWDGLTNPDIIKQYFYGTNLDTDWQVGSSMVFTGEYEGTKYVDKGTVQEFVAEQKLSYAYLSSFSGMEDKPENYLLVSYKVAPVDGGTKVTISQSNYDEERAQHAAAGWETVLNGLKNILA